MNHNIRYALLAGTMLLPAIAVPQASVAADSFAARASEGAIILAQAPAIDPQTGKPYPKGVQPKGPQPKGPSGAQPGGQPPAGAGGPAPGAPKVGVQPKSNQPLQGNVQPGAQPPAGAGTPAPGAQPRQLGVQPKSNQPLQGSVQPGGQSPAGAGAPAGAGTPAPGAQPRQFGVQPKSNQPLQGSVQPGGQSPAGPGTPAGAGAQPQGVQPRQFGVQPNANQPVQSNVQPGGQPRGFGGQGPAGGGGQPAAMTGNVDQLRTQRQERREAGGRIVIEEPGNRLIVRENGQAFVRHDEGARFRMWGDARMERRGGEQFAYVSRPGGYQIVTVTDDYGRLLRRIRRDPDGREVVLIDNRLGPGLAVGVGVGLAAGVILGLAAPVITIPRERYIVDVSTAPAPLLYEALEAPPLVAIERPYSLDEIRYNVALRDRMRRIDIDSVTFDTGSWEVTPEQQPKLQAVADAMLQVLSRKPDEVFLVEGHTDAVGNDVDNLSLSDRRAESVAVILSSAFQIPPENLVTQGYGAHHLKIPTDGPSRENRRVTARRITPLLQGGVASR
jgi:outer membrane protein OmpA-like peptidoglycan-associated protein